jgi:hypothetical protein
MGSACRCTIFQVPSSGLKIIVTCRAIGTTSSLIHPISWNVAFYEVRGSKLPSSSPRSVHRGGAKRAPATTRGK